jgi:uroporphyrinogen decarboxylase
MNSREKFLAAMNGKNTGRPPVWVMRQAGRYLPEYRKLKEKHGFLGMVKNPELASTVTLQPLQRFQLDAAILFCDILVIPEAMGQPYNFREGGGIAMQVQLESQKCVEKLNIENIADKLSYVEGALRILRNELGNNKALLGFCGSPWTLACYMIEGESKEGFPKAVEWAKNHPIAFNCLLEKITRATISYLKMQSACGVDAVQIFDSWQSICPHDKAWEWSLKWIHQIIDELNESVPVILYAKAPIQRIDLLRKTGANGLSVSQVIDLSELRANLQDKYVLQGNLPPELLETDAKTVKKKTSDFLHRMKDDPAHIVNLGHGIRPQAKIECMDSLVRTVTEFKP